MGWQKCPGSSCALKIDNAAVTVTGNGHAPLFQREAMSKCWLNPLVSKVCACEMGNVDAVVFQRLDDCGRMGATAGLDCDV